MDQTIIATLISLIEDYAAKRDAFGQDQSGPNREAWGLAQSTALRAFHSFLAAHPQRLADALKLLAMAPA